MNETDYNSLIDETLNTIEDAVENSAADIDIENTGGVLTLICEDGSSIIFSRQSACQELWIAARSGGYHLTWQHNGWYCQKHKQTLAQLFAAITQEQTGEAIVLE